MDDRQVLLGNLWITTLGNSEVLIAALTEASIDDGETKSYVSFKISSGDVPDEHASLPRPHVSEITSARLQPAQWKPRPSPHGGACSR